MGITRRCVTGDIRCSQVLNLTGTAITPCSGSTSDSSGTASGTGTSVVAVATVTASGSSSAGRVRRIEGMVVGGVKMLAEISPCRCVETLQQFSSSAHPLLKVTFPLLCVLRDSIK
jgi:hypothetical protein